VELAPRQYVSRGSLTRSSSRVLGEGAAERYRLTCIDVSAGRLMSQLPGSTVVERAGLCRRTSLCILAGGLYVQVVSRYPCRPMLCVLERI
jgi:hypothetical protein